MKKTKMLFLAIAIAVVSISAIVFGLALTGSRVKAIEVIDPWNFCPEGEDCSGTYEEEKNDSNEVNVPVNIPPDETHSGCVKKGESTTDTDACCCAGLAHALFHCNDGETTFDEDMMTCVDSKESCDMDCGEADQDYLDNYFFSDGDVPDGMGGFKKNTILSNLSSQCSVCLGRTGKPSGCQETWFPPFIDPYIGLYNVEACASKPVFRCSSGEEDCKEDDGPCSYPMTSANSSGIFVRSSSKNESQLRKALDEALGKLGPELGKYLNKLEGLNDKEFKKLLKSENPKISQAELDGVSGLSTIGDNGENITIINEDHFAIKKYGDLSNILGHEIAHFHRYALGQEDSRFTVAWHQVAGDVYDSSLLGKSTWPDGSKSKNGCVNTYACSDTSGTEDMMETLRRAIRDPEKFKSLFLDPDSPSYDPRFKAKLELLVKFGFITQAQLNAILCVGK